MADESISLDEVQALLDLVAKGDGEAWKSVYHRCLDQLAKGNSRPWIALITICLSQAAHGNETSRSKLVDACVKHREHGFENSGIELVIQVCLDRVAQGDESAWNALQEFTFEQLIGRCERMLQQKLSRNNPLITSNALAAEVYLRLNKAIMENKSAVPKNAKEYFGLAGRNIRWQLTDMLRKPSMDQGDSSLFEQLAQTSGIDTQVDANNSWERFWKTVNELPDDQKEVFDLLWIHELSQYEAANVLGITRDKVKDLWRRIRLHIATNCSELAAHIGR